MTDEMGLLSNGQIALAALERDVALSRFQQAGNELEKACLARSIAPFEEHELAFTR